MESARGTYLLDEGPKGSQAAAPLKMTPIKWRQFQWGREANSTHGQHHRSWLGRPRKGPLTKLGTSGRHLEAGKAPLGGGRAQTQLEGEWGLSRWRQQPVRGGPGAAVEGPHVGCPRKPASFPEGHRR